MVVTCTLKFPQHVSNIEWNTNSYIVIVFLSWSVNYVLLRNFPIFHVRQQNRRCECSIRYWIGIRRIRKVSHIESGHTVLTEAVAWCTRDLRQNQCVRLWWRQHYGSILDMYEVSYFISNIFLEGSYSVRRLFSVKTKKTMKAAQKAVYKNPVPSKSSRTPCPRSQAERVSKRKIIRWFRQRVVTSWFSKSTM
jgi:hypothetical protein